ncbi:MAG: hypothetical protein RL088_3370 [Verrucomicrobiota bacterium]|jgi:autotransporter-associated beta strand protein
MPHKSRNARKPPAFHPLILAAGIVSACGQAFAQTPLSLTGPSYTQNFDGSTSALPVGWGFGQGVPFSNTTIISTQTAGTTGAGILSGSSPAGAYHFVNGTVGVSTERAIGYITGAAPFTNNRDIIFAFQNTTGQNITSLSLSFDYEKYRAGIQSREWTFYASANDSAWGSAISAGTQSYSGDLNSIDVFNPPLSVTKSVTIGGITIAPNSSYFLRWNYNGSGTGSGAQALGLDNLILSATLSGGLLFWDTNGALAGLGGSGTWDTTTANWNPLADGTGTTIVADAAREVVFSGTAGTVTIGAGAAANAGIRFQSSGYVLNGGSLALGGTAPATITVSSSSHTATISAAISGTSGLKKAGLGSLLLASANSFSGGTTISAGTVEISSDTALGASSGGIVLESGKLRTTASITLSASRSLTGSGLLDIASSTTLNVPGATTAGDIVLQNSGTLRLSGSLPSVTSITFESDGLLDGGGGELQLGGPVTSANPVGTATISATLNLGNILRTFTVGDGLGSIDLLLSGAVSSGASGRILKLGGGTLSLSAINSALFGGIQLGNASTNGGVISIASGGSLGGASNFVFHAGTLRATAALTGVNAVPAGVTLIFGGTQGLASTFDGSTMRFLGSAQFSGTNPHSIVANSDVSIAGAVSGSSPAITVRGTGSLTLESGGAFTGDVTIDGGTLFLTAGFTAVSRPAITVIASGTLGGDITSGNLGALIASGGSLSPGTALDPTGILAGSAAGFALDVQAGGSLRIQIAGNAPADYDRFAITGGVRLCGDLLLGLINGFVPTENSVFTIINNDATDAVSGTFAGLPQGFQIAA